MTFRDRQCVDQAEKLLGVVVVQVSVVILGGQVLGDFPVAAGEVERVAFTSAARGSQPGLIA
ncbi:hypothetical protein D3C84_1212670 [compost metagenome]